MNRFRLFVLALLVAAGTPALARAADIYVPPPIPVAEPTGFDWNGFYAGVGIGYEGWSGAGTSDTLLLGGELGFNTTFDRLLLGFEASAAPYYLIDEGEVAWRVGVDARFGVLATDSVLLYASAGVEYDSLYQTYGTVGLGAEFGLTDSVSVDLGYDYVWDVDDPGSAAHRVGASVLWHF